VFKNVSAPGMVEFWSHSDNDRCGGDQILWQAFSVHQGEEVEMRFSTSRDLTLSASWHTHYESCRIYVTFRPVAGETYAALYGHEGKKCAFVVFHDRGAAGGGLETERSFRVRSGNPYVLGKGCPSETK
jgi:hypothetical protein